MRRRSFLAGLLALPVVAPLASLFRGAPEPSLSMADLEQAHSELEKLPSPPETVEVPFNDGWEVIAVERVNGGPWSYIATDQHGRVCRVEMPAHG